MARAKIGVILPLVKPKIDEVGVYETFRLIRQTGVTAVELSQFEMSPENVAEVKRACQDFGMTICAMTAGLEPNLMARRPPQGPQGDQPARKPPKADNLAEDYDKIVADMKTLNCTFLRMGMLPMQYLQSEEKLIEFAQKADQMSDRLAKDGISFYYHTHHFEFIRFNGKFALDIIRDHSSKIGFELDVHWIWRGGQDPVKFIRTYDGRVKLLHLKDYRIGPIRPDGGMAGIIDIVQFAEVGEGSLDMAAIIETGLACGAQHLIIEQDTTYGRDPIESLAISANSLRNLGYGDCF